MGRTCQSVCTDGSCLRSATSCCVRRSTASATWKGSPCATLLRSACCSMRTRPVRSAVLYRTCLSRTASGHGGSILATAWSRSWIWCRPRWGFAGWRAPASNGAGAAPGHRDGTTEPQHRADGCCRTAIGADACAVRQADARQGLDPEHRSRGSIAMGLQQTLTEMMTQRPATYRALLNDLTEVLHKAALPGVLKEGDPMPDFVLPDADGELVS